MNQYEALYIIDAALTEEATRESIEKFKGIVEANGGEIVAVDEWGKRKLAYPIDYKTEGTYVLMSFNSAPELPRELERNYKNDEKILRYMVTVKEA
ncbi:MAG: 30S ribosomal protein S6 [Clostridia bacterium]|nr:30S ribosomal protein S6 [Clostridia bacterium]